MQKNEFKAKYCPVCDSTFQSYLPLWKELAEQLEFYETKYGTREYEMKNRQEILCPSCGALDRERMVAWYLLKRLGKGFCDKNFRVIEFAPRVHLTAFLVKNFDFLHQTADLFMENVDYNIDISNMPILETSSVNMWISLHILEHVADDKAAFKELYRILKPSGFGLFLVPIDLGAKTTAEDIHADTEERWRRFGQDDHIRLYARQDLLTRIKEAGFKVQQLGQNYFGEEVFAQLGLPRKACLYILEK